MAKPKIIIVNYNEKSGNEVLKQLEDAKIIVCLDNIDKTATYVAARGVNKKALRDFAKKILKEQETA